MQEIILQQSYKKTLSQYSENQKPNESCALLFGKNNQVLDIFLTENIEKSPINFTISNEQLIEGYKMAENKKMEIIGIFHSHPNSDAFPSNTDKKFMQSNPIAWIIYSGINKNFRAFILESDTIEIPINEKNNPNFLYSKNLIKFCRNKGWYSKGSFNVNKILGDKKGKWKGVKWIENKMKKLSKKSGKIKLKDVMWAIRTPKLTGDTAGYGQVVPLIDPSHNNLRMLWHSPIGAVASPFSPVFIGQTKIPEEFMMHRYLTVGESHRFSDERKKENIDTLSLVDQGIESTISAVYECKRLFYLILQNKKNFIQILLKLLKKEKKN